MDTNDLTCFSACRTWCSYRLLKTWRRLLCANFFSVTLRPSEWSWIFSLITADLCHCCWWWKNKKKPFCFTVMTRFIRLFHCFHTWTLSKYGDFPRISSKHVDVPLDPLQSCDLVHEAIVPYGEGGAESGEGSISGGNLLWCGLVSGVPFSLSETKPARCCVLAAWTKFNSFQAEGVRKWATESGGFRIRNVSAGEAAPGTCRALARPAITPSCHGNVSRLMGHLTSRSQRASLYYVTEVTARLIKRQFVSRSEWKCKRQHERNGLRN